MAPVFSSLQFDHDQARFLVEPEKIDPSLTIFPFSELFSHDQYIRRNYIYLCFQHVLKIVSLEHPVGLKSGTFYSHDLAIINSE